MPYNAQGQWVADNTTQAGSTFDQDIGQFVPLDLLGSQGRINQFNDARKADQNRGYWDNLGSPSASQLDSQQGQDAQSRALQQMQQWSSGALTSTDRSTLEASRQRDAQASGSAQRSLMQQAQARGVGGSGLDFATRQQASQQGQQQASDAESAAMQGAQTRGVAATQASAQIGSQMREQAGQGQQRAFDNAAARAAGATGQYGTDMTATQRGRDRRQQSDQAGVGLIAGLFS